MNNQTTAKCDTCGNTYDKTFTLSVDGNNYTFDSFECAIHKVAKECLHCGCKIIGHGVESDLGIFCCAHCARKMGEDELVDRQD